MANRGSQGLLRLANLARSQLIEYHGLQGSYFHSLVSRDQVLCPVSSSSFLHIQSFEPSLFTRPNVSFASCLPPGCNLPGETLQPDSLAIHVRRPSIPSFAATSTELHLQSCRNLHRTVFHLSGKRGESSVSELEDDILLRPTSSLGGQSATDSDDNVQELKERLSERPGNLSTGESSNIDTNSLTGNENGKESQRKQSSRHDLAILFTCTICDTRSAKTMSRATYETGVVIVRCPSCSNLHLIADRKGWFGEPGSVEDFLESKGVGVRKGVEETYEFSVEDLTGWSDRL